MEEKVNMRIKKSFCNHWLTVRLNLSLDNEQNCDEKNAFIKKGVLNLAYIQGFSFEKSKQPNKFTASKTHTNV